MKKGQASVEYVIITAFVLLIIGILAFYSLYSYEQTINQNKINQAVNILGNAVNQVYAAGPGNVVFVEIDLPKNIRSGFVGWHSINYVVGTIEGGDVYFTTNATISYRLLPITEGKHWFRVAMEDENVSIIETSAGGLSQSEIFSFDWSSSQFSGSSNQILERWTIKNNGNFDIKIERIKVDWVNDSGGALLKLIELNSEIVFNSMTGVPSGSWIELNGVNGAIIPARQTILIGNSFEWTDVEMNNEGEQFMVTFEFEDGSQFVSQTCTASGINCLIG